MRSFSLATDYSYGWNPEIVVNVDVPFAEEKGFGSFSQLGVVDTNELYLPTSLSQWSTDPAIFQGINDQQHAAAFNSINRQQQQQRIHQSPAVYDLSIESPAADVKVSQSNSCQQLMLLGIQQHEQQKEQVTPNSSINSSTGGMSSSPVAGEIYPWMNQMILNHFLSQERGCINDQMPALVSDFSAQQPCLYTSSSECVQQDAADSSGSSGARENYTLPAGTTEDITWRNSVVINNNNLVVSSSTGFHIGELYDETSSVAAAAPIDHVDISEAKDQSSSLSLVVQRYNNPAGLIERSPSLSWAMPATESDTSLGGGRGMSTNNCATLDSQQLLNIACFQDMTGGGGLSSTSSQEQPPYKRPRLGYTSAAVEPAATATTSCSRPLISSTCSSFSRHRSMMGGRGSDYPMTSLKVADALYRDFNFSSMQQISPCSGSSFHPRAVIPNSTSPVGAYASLRTGTTLADHDYTTTTMTSNSKHNATSIEPQSVAARHRRKKISERVRVLEKLIPGGSKMDTASMLDEAIDYVKFLQLQVSLMEKLGELPDNGNSTSQLQTSPSSSPTSNGAVICRPTTITQTIPARPTTSPLILSEILQQQLFKQKLCLVSLRQYPSGASPSGSFV
ncbi:hypothetical protein R1flu_004883 [Riccia fluitans]|uniref:BHLH domain-containing protein n=1 Tax=Riccia fluitans TaxID=41844 RepID=A0ABD1YSJ4_9MARC